MIEKIGDVLSQFYLAFSESVPDNMKPFFILAFYTLMLFLYVIFIWKFYKFISKRDFLELNLSQYNINEDSTFYQFLAIILYILEYIIILPVLVFFWFSVLALFFFIMSKMGDVNQILLISASVIAVIRITSYYFGELSQDIAKLIPLTLLTLLMFEEGFFSIQKLLDNFYQIPSLFGNILAYFIFIMAIEFIMRIIYLIFPKE